MNEPLYTREILRLAAEVPGRVGFDKVGEGVVIRSPTCGSRMAMVVTLDEGGRVASLSQAVEACAFGQAAAALVGSGAAGTDLTAAQSAEQRVAGWLTGETDAEPWPGMAVLDPARARTGRHGAILLPFRALVAAIEATAR